ncbi:hypothetical protein G3I59_14400 [Amycolatopsis rubida]|uniref:Nitronate monooxygenase n=1 Tax=Amycolatopsis rubida TaxID=112413 RepID=A0A1I6AY08_9PSEU|nr:MULTISPECIES: hypothetical protein [Amycolatopsis]NEC56739.1 hypothetical protein [Amycolatopsis rubida]OAP21676.1 hypothetical protein A4R44_07469 [Amycolatopsis sp. M39]SFQ73519.1 hypothetical protein SAMN05421854_121113 [Amycolatopsis rubida]
MLRFPKQVCATLGIDVPIGSASGLERERSGTLALTWTDPDEAIRRIREVRRRTDRPFAVNLVLGFPIGDVLDACLAEEVPPGSPHV